MTKWFVSRATIILSAPHRSFLPRFQKPPKGVRTRNLAVQGIGSAKRRARTRPFSYSGAVLPRRASRGFRRASPASIPASPSGFPRLVPSREGRDVQRPVVSADGYPKPSGIAHRYAQPRKPLSGALGACAIRAKRASRGRDRILTAPPARGDGGEYSPRLVGMSRGL
jgi:hypothetical protein